MQNLQIFPTLTNFTLIPFLPSFTDLRFFVSSLLRSSEDRQYRKFWLSTYRKDFQDRQNFQASKPKGFRKAHLAQDYVASLEERLEFIVDESVWAAENGRYDVLDQYADNLVLLAKAYKEAAQEMKG